MSKEKAWCEFPTIKRIRPSRLEPGPYYDQLKHMVNYHRDAVSQFNIECRFHQDRTPYYEVWPGVAKGLSKVTLDVDSGLF